MVLDSCGIQTLLPEPRQMELLQMVEGCVRVLLSGADYDADIGAYGCSSHSGLTGGVAHYLQRWFASLHLDPKRRKRCLVRLLRQSRRRRMVAETQRINLLELYLVLLILPLLYLPP